MNSPRDPVADFELSIEVAVSDTFYNTSKVHTNKATGKVWDLINMFMVCWV
jgi:hypothetical protein